MTDKANNYEEGLQAFHEQDYEKAYCLLVSFAEQGHAEAQCIIGNLYDMGLGRPRNVEEARKWYLKSSAQGYGVASHNLGTMASVQNDLAGALRWYLKAEEQGFLGMSREDRQKAYGG
jgi:TPR repeat protein